MQDISIPESIVKEEFTRTTEKHMCLLAGLVFS